MGKKRLVLILCLIIVMAFFVKIRFTGYDILASELKIYRLIQENAEQNTKDVTLTILSPEKVLAVHEDVECEVLDYGISEDFDIFEFKPSETTWVIADREYEINTYLSYSVPLDCEILGGNFYIIGVKECGGDLNKDREVNYLDLAVLSSCYDVFCPENEICPGSVYKCSDADVSGLENEPDGKVDLIDLGILASDYDRDCSLEEIQGYGINQESFKQDAINAGIDSEAVDNALVVAGTGQQLTAINTEEIKQEEFESVSEKVKQAILRIKGEKVSIPTDISRIISIVLIISAAGIIISFIILFLKKPKNPGVKK